MILNMTDTNLWKNPYDGKEYEVGETIPVYDYGGGGLVYGSTVVKYEDPGFPGVVQTKGEGELHAYSMTMLETEIQQWVLPVIEPESDWFFIGPAEIGWRERFAHERKSSRSRPMNRRKSMRSSTWTSTMRKTTEHGIQQTN